MARGNRGQRATKSSEKAASAQDKNAVGVDADAAPAPAAPAAPNDASPRETSDTPEGASAEAPAPAPSAAADDETKAHASSEETKSEEPAAEAPSTAATAEAPEPPASHASPAEPSTQGARDAAAPGGGALAAADTAVAAAQLPAVDKPLPAPDEPEAPARRPSVDPLLRLEPDEREAELRSQVTGLNAKLVASFNRMADLEDELSVAHNRILVHTTQIAELSKERDQYIAALSTGLLVERAHVTSEMQRMMERVADEAAQRGKAESDRTRIEQELEELTASLFNEANKMVALERLARAKAEEKCESLERSLHDTENLMREQQELMSHIQHELEAKQGPSAGLTPHLAAQTEPVAASAAPAPAATLSKNIPAYKEFEAYLAHLRGLHQQLAPYFELARRGIDWTTHPSTNPSAASSGVASPGLAGSPSPLRHRDYPHLPLSCESLVQLSSQTALPFLRRMQEEDTDPCLRLAHAPGLNWLARRQAPSALLDGQVTIEPLFAGDHAQHEALRAEYGHLPPTPCALCAAPLLNLTSLLPGATPADGTLRAATGELAQSLREGSGRRSFPALFSSLRRGLQGMDRSGTPPAHDAKHEGSTEIFSQDAPMSGSPATPAAAELWDVPTHYFRLNEQATHRYLVCSHQCLARLRIVCAFWAFIRTLERAMVLEGKLAPTVASAARTPAADASVTTPAAAAEALAPVPKKLHDTRTGPSATDDADAPHPVVKQLETTAEEAVQASAAEPKDAASEPAAEEKEEAVAAADDAKDSAAKNKAEPKDAKDDDAPDVPTVGVSEAAEAPKAATDVSSEADDDAKDDMDVFDEALDPTDAAGDETPAVPPRSAPASPVPPKLPMRRPTLPPLPGAPTAFERFGDSAQLSWEESLWAEVVRFKELMWKARVGMDLAHLEIV